MTLKQEATKMFLQQLDEKIDGYNFAIDQLSESVLNETKSTAGDKHETALSMLQLEQSQLAKHLYEAVDNKTVFLQIDFDNKSDSVKSGSLVKTNRGYFLISIALPKIIIEGKTIISISPQSPLAIALLGHSVKDEIMLNGMQHTIEEIS